ncbi:MAG: HIT family protein [Alphaproteobacteria bacterium]|nr:HIT family protein [Alphaproteobacteria bacterium]
MSFELDPRLAADTVELDRWDLSQVLLMKDANYPWLVLVPMRTGLRDLIDLAPADRPVMNAEIQRAGERLRRMTGCHKLNIASLGNQVAQLHVHIIARFTDDPAWPRPVWGVQPAKPHAPEALADFRRRWREA